MYFHRSRRFPLPLGRKVHFIPALLVVMLWATLGAATPAILSDRIDRIVDNTDTAIWSIYVKDLQTGRVLYSKNANLPVMPASNEKLFTTATALEALGADFRYRTRLLFDGKVDGSVLKGDLIIVGSGDPTIGSVETRGVDPLRAWAQALKEIGVTAIEGRIIGDDNVFDDRRYGEGWDIDYLTNQASRELGISASGLSYRDNVVEVGFKSAGVGDPPKITSRPGGYLKIINQATTASRRRGWALDVERDFSNDVLTVTGSLPRSYQGALNVPVANPTMLAVYSFAQYLQRNDIETRARLFDIDDLEEIPDESGASLLFVHFSPPLSEIVATLNKESNNFYAEQVFRTMAYGGSAAGGERRIKDLLSRAGVNDPSISIKDGSGLSRKDLITTQAMVGLLSYMATNRAFVQSLAEGGEAHSTLRGRLGGLPVHAKTGSLESVRSLSGYATTADGHRVAFSIISNHYTAPSYQVTQTIDQIIRAVTSANPA
ncbi:MAG TPA: D-alanyl-D-alanine carboxypeptidase/D-alanyl-D-alanine-endopeptidase [Rhodothermales bacterium]|nr:D-alanyl-D-alanine carboxypeptidase/D-alanyl-D-alanine-endopeptidase [Rhodothermales bacterium]